MEAEGKGEEWDGGESRKGGDRGEREGRAGEEGSGGDEMIHDMWPNVVRGCL